MLNVAVQLLFFRETLLIKIIKGVFHVLDIELMNNTPIIIFVIHCSHHVSSHWLKAYS